MNTSNLLFTTLAAAVLATFAAPTQAAESYRTTLNHGSVACSGTASNYRGMLKSRAEGNRNDTINVSVVQCGGVATPLNQSGDVLVYEVGFNNSTGADVTINCSLSDGIGAAGGWDQTLYPKSVTVPANSAAYLSWNGLDTGGTSWDNGARFVYPAATCQLPQNAEISYTALIYYVDVGQ